MSKRFCVIYQALRAPPRLSVRAPDGSPPLTPERGSKATAEWAPSPSQGYENAADDQRNAEYDIGRHDTAEDQRRQHETADRGQRQHLSRHCRRYHRQHLPPQEITEGCRDDAVVGEDRDKLGRPAYGSTDRPGERNNPDRNDADRELPEGLDPERRPPRVP